jgi:hypothetical protein
VPQAEVQRPSSGRQGAPRIYRQGTYQRTFMPQLKKVGGAKLGVECLREEG